MKMYKKYTYRELTKILDLYSQGKSIKEIAGELGRTPNTIKRLSYVLLKAMKLTPEERKEHFVRNRVSVGLFEKVVNDYLGGVSLAEGNDEDEEGEEKEVDLIALSDRVDETRVAFEDALVDYVIEATKMSQRRRLKEIEAKYKNQVDNLGEKVRELEEVKEAAKRSNLSYTLRRRLLGDK